MDEFTILVTLTRQDFRRLLLRRIDKKLIPIGFGTFIFLLVFFSVTSHFVIENPPNYIRYIVLGIIAGFPFLVMALYLRHIFVKAQKFESIQRPTKHVFGDVDIRSEQEGRSTKMIWPAFQTLIESGHVFLLYGEGVYITIPKRCFSDEKEIADFRQMIRERSGAELQSLR